jgi:hypothetical protein
MKCWSVFVLCLAGLAACAAEPRWVNPGQPAARTSADLAACRRSADRDLGPGAYQAPGEERTSDPMRMAEHSQTLRRFDSLVAECMQDKGYTAAK